MAGTGEPPGGFDVFLSHGTPDKPWVGRLRDELETLGLRVFLDESELKPGDNWTLALSDGLLRSRCLALVLTRETLARPWVEHEWTSFMAEHGPRSGRIIPVLLDPVDLPPFLKPIQAIDATHRDAARVAREIGRADRPARRPAGGRRPPPVHRPGPGLRARAPGRSDRRRRPDRPPPRGRPALGPGRSLHRRPARIRPADPRGDSRTTPPAPSCTATPPPWAGCSSACSSTSRPGELLRQATLPGRPGRWSASGATTTCCCRSPGSCSTTTADSWSATAVVDLARSVPGEVGPGALLRPPTGPFTLVVNVSAPEGSGLDYEARATASPWP